MALLSNDIYIGSLGAQALFHFVNTDLDQTSMLGVFTVDVIGNELPIDTVYFTVHYDPAGATRDIYGTSTAGEAYILSDSREYLLKKPAARDLLQSIPYGTPVWWYCGGALQAKCYASKVERIAKFDYKITCISGVGLLDNKIHVGGLYTGESFSEVMAEIVSSAFAYNVVAALQNVRVYGHLPYDSARANLHRLLFAMGACMFPADEYSDYRVGFPPTSPSSFPANRIIMGGSVDYQLPSNRAEITEHGFFQTPGDPVVVLYDNSGDQSVDNLPVIFKNAPVYDVSATENLVINELSVNHAVVSGTGTLTGRAYTHSRQIMAVGAETNDPERTRRVEENELINTLNSRMVARRVLAYFMRTRIIKSKLLVTTQKAGAYLTLADAYGDPITGYIQKMEFTPTALRGANCEIADGFVSDSHGNTFTKRYIARYSQFPNGTTIRLTFNTNNTKALRFVMIGAGTGGQGGYDGENGCSPALADDYYDTTAPREEEDGYYWDMYAMVAQYIDDPNSPERAQTTPQGGEAGAAGSAGKINVVDVDLSFAAPNTTFVININATLGAPGAGGDAGGGLGSAGGDTSFSTLIPGLTPSQVTASSADGVVIDNGWADLMTGDVFLLPGADGVRGGNGGRVDTVSDNGCADFRYLIPYNVRHNVNRPVRGYGADGLPGESVTNGNGGAGGAGYGFDGTILTHLETAPGGGSTTYRWYKGYNFNAQKYAPWTNTGDVGINPDNNVLYPQAASGGGGGGGAYGASGSPGTAPVAENLSGDLFTGNGGDGATALPPPDVGIGGGGNGGNGGGAGGNGGGGYTYGASWRVYWHGTVNYATSSGTVGGLGGTGGAGSRGGNGGEGALIIYY